MMEVPSKTAGAPRIVERIRLTKSAMSANQVGEFLGCTSANVLKLAREGRIPHYRIRSMIRFDPSEVADWLQQRAA